MRKARQRMTRAPVKRPFIGVRTPLAEFTAALARYCWQCSWSRGRRSPWQGVGDGDGLDEGAKDVGPTHRQHLLVHVHWFPSGWLFLMSNIFICGLKTIVLVMILIVLIIIMVMVTRLRHQLHDPHQKLWRWRPHRWWRPLARWSGRGQVWRIFWCCLRIQMLVRL